MNVFVTDSSIFTPILFTYIETQNWPLIKSYLIEKHLDEVLHERHVFDKKNDLIIWNALLAKEIASLGIYKFALHPLYNRYYKEIQINKSLSELQNLELRMFETYVNSMKSDILIKENYTVNKILVYIHLNIENHLSIKEIATSLSLSQSYISTVFKQVIGISLMEYVKSLKIERAKHYLLTSDLSILELADLFGFHDSSHFTKIFKEYTGLNPTQFRIHKEK